MALKGEGPEWVYPVQAASAPVIRPSQRLDMKAELGVTHDHMAGVKAADGSIVSKPLPGAVVLGGTSVIAMALINKLVADGFHPVIATVQDASTKRAKQLKAMANVVVVDGITFGGATPPPFTQLHRAIHAHSCESRIQVVASCVVTRKPEPVNGKPLSYEDSMHMMGVNVAGPLSFAQQLVQYLTTCTNPDPTAGVPPAVKAPDAKVPYPEPSSPSGLSPDAAVTNALPSTMGVTGKPSVFVYPDTPVAEGTGDAAARAGDEATAEPCDPEGIPAAATGAPPGGDGATARSEDSHATNPAELPSAERLEWRAKVWKARRPVFLFFASSRASMVYVGSPDMNGVGDASFIATQSALHVGASMFARRADVKASGAQVAIVDPRLHQSRAFPELGPGMKSKDANETATLLLHLVESAAKGRAEPLPRLIDLYRLPRHAASHAASSAAAEAAARHTAKRVAVCDRGVFDEADEKLRMAPLAATGVSFASRAASVDGAAGAGAGAGVGAAAAAPRPASVAGSAPPRATSRADGADNGVGGGGGGGGGSRGDVGSDAGSGGGSARK